jgi:hypothetical protein
MASNFTNATGFGSNQRIEVESVEEKRFRPLTFEQGAFDAKYRGIGKDDFAFPGRNEVTLEVKRAEIVDEIFVEALLEQIIATFPVKRLWVQEQTQGLFQAGEDYIPSIKRVFSKKAIKGGAFFMSARQKVALSHGELVEIGPEAGMEGVVHNYALK